MLISIHDKTLQRVGFIDNEKPDTLHFYNDTWHRYLTEATSTFDFTVPKTGHASLQFLTEKHYVSFQYEGKDYLFNIMKIEETETELTCYTENLNLELLNEISPAYTAPQAMTFEQYLENGDIVGIQDLSDVVLGINEVSDYSRTLSWEGTETKLARLLSLVNKFDAECEFVTELNRDGSLNRIVLNVYKQHDDDHQGVGTRRQDVTLYYGKSIKSVRRTVDKTELYSAIYPTGRDGLTIASVEKTEYDADGKVLYYTHSGQPNIYAPQTAEEYPTQISTDGDKWILYRWEYDTDNVNTLYGQALAKLKDISQPALTYEIEGTYDLAIGDTVIIHDDKFTPTLLLEARVSEQEISFTNPSQNKNIYSNFKALENQLSTDITSRLDEIRAEAAPYTAEILTDNGIFFKNGEGTTTLTARIMRAGNDVTSQVALQWTKDGTPVSTQASITIAAEDVPTKANYRLTVKNAGGTVLCTAEVTVARVDDGKDGKGIATVDIEYCQSDSAATPPADDDKGWSTDPPTWINGKHVWQRTVTRYSDGLEETSAPVCLTGEAGKQGVSATAIEEEYYLSLSNTEQVGGEWTLTCPEWQEGHYIWTRSKCSWSDGTTTYTTPMLAGALNSANSTASGALNTANAAINQISAVTIRVDTLEAGNVEISGKLTAAEADIEKLRADIAEVGDLSAINAEIDNLKAQDVTITGRLDAAEASITTLETETAKISTLEADIADIGSLTAGTGWFGQIKGQIAAFGDLSAGTGMFGQLKADIADIDDAMITDAEIKNLLAGYATIENLNAATAEIGKVTADVADITLLLSGQTVSGSTQTIVLNAQNTTVDSGFFKNLVAQNISVGDLLAGKISTDKFQVGSDDNSILMSGSTLQIKDKQRVRVQIGKDGTGDYSLSVYDAAGNLMWDARGAKAAAIKDKIIVNDMVSENAAIAGSKLNIPSVVQAINGGTTKINTSVITYDPTGQTLDVVFGNLETTVDKNSSSIGTHTTQISTMQGQISTLITDVEQVSEDLEDANGSITTLTNNYSSLNQTVGSINSSVSSLKTEVSKKADGSTVTSLSSRLTEVEQTANGITTEVSNLDETVTSLKQEVTASSIVTKINTQLSNGGKIETTKFTMDKNGLTIQNGGLKIQGATGNTVLQLDTNGNVKAGKITADYIQTGTITIGKLDSSTQNSINNATKRIKSTVNLSASTYNADTFYPVTGSAIPTGGYHEFIVAVQLNSGTKPAWSTHQNGFTCNLSVRCKACGWGVARGDMGWIDDASYLWCDQMPAYFQQMENSSTPVLYLRGGGAYIVYTDYACTWTPRTSTYTTQQNSVSPIKLPNKPTNYTLLGNHWDNDTALASWCYNNDLTYINGAKIYTGSLSADKITTGTLKAVTIQSMNYVENGAGMKLTLSDGVWDSKNFKIASNGDVTAGTIKLPADTGKLNFINRSGSITGSIYGLSSSDRLWFDTNLNFLFRTNFGKGTHARFCLADEYSDLNFVDRFVLTNYKESEGTETRNIINLWRSQKTFAIRSFSDLGPIRIYGPGVEINTTLNVSNAVTLENALNVSGPASLTTLSAGSTILSSTLTVNGSSTLKALTCSSLTVNGKSLLNRTYPVGSIYMSVNSTSPATLFGGTWVELQGRFLIGRSSSYTNGSTGGASTVALSAAQMPAHKHYAVNSNTSTGFVRSGSGGASANVAVTGQGYVVAPQTDSTGSGSSHNNMPPYLAVYMWKRTA